MTNFTHSKGLNPPKVVPVGTAVNANIQRISMMELVESQVEPETCKCQVHLYQGPGRELTPEEVQSVGSHPTVRGAATGETTYCHLSPAQRMRNQLLATALIRPWPAPHRRACAAEGLDPEVAGMRSTHGARLSDFGFGYCYLGAIRPRLRWQVAQLCGPWVKATEFAMCLVWCGRSRLCKFEISETAHGYFHISFDEQSKAVLTGTSLLQFILTMTRGNPEARIGGKIGVSPSREVFYRKSDTGKRRRESTASSASSKASELSDARSSNIYSQSIVEAAEAEAQGFIDSLQVPACTFDLDYTELTRRVHTFVNVPLSSFNKRAMYGLAVAYKVKHGCPSSGRWHVDISRRKNSISVLKVCVDDEHPAGVYFFLDTVFMYHCGGGANWQGDATKRGYCYLLLVSPEYAQAAEEELGAWPTKAKVFDFISRNKTCFSEEGVDITSKVILVEGTPTAVVHVHKGHSQPREVLGLIARAARIGGRVDTRFYLWKALAKQLMKRNRTTLLPAGKEGSNLMTVPLIVSQPNFFRRKAQGYTMSIHVPGGRVFVRGFDYVRVGEASEPDTYLTNRQEGRFWRTDDGRPLYLTMKGLAKLFVSQRTSVSWLKVLSTVLGCGYATLANYLKSIPCDPKIPDVTTSGEEVDRTSTKQVVYRYIIKKVASREIPTAPPAPPVIHPQEQKGNGGSWLLEPDPTGAANRANFRQSYPEDWSRRVSGAALRLMNQDLANQPGYRAKFEHPGRLIVDPEAFLILPTPARERHESGSGPSLFDQIRAGVKLRKVG